MTAAVLGLRFPTLLRERFVSCNREVRRTVLKHGLYRFDQLPELRRIRRAKTYGFIARYER